MTDYDHRAVTHLMAQGHGLQHRLEEWTAKGDKPDQ